MTKYIYVETDFHSNNIWGLMNPATEIEAQTPGGETYYSDVTLNPEQEFMHDLRTQTLAGVKKIVGKKPVTYLFLGDVVQGFKHYTTTVSNSPYAQQCIAKANLDPVFEKLNIEAARFVFGTVAHDGNDHDAIRSIMSHAKSKCLDSRMLWHGLAKAGGLLIDYSHHGAGKGRRDWLKGNEMRYYTKSVMSQELKRGNSPPDVILRGHFHGYHWETIRERIKDRTYTTEFILVPSWCGMGAYGKQVTRSEYLISNGGILLEIDKDRLFVHDDWIVERDLRLKEVL